MSHHDVILEFADKLVAMAAIELLSPGIEGRDEEKKILAIVEVALGEIEQPSSHTFALGIGRDRNRGDVGRARETVRGEQNEPDRRSIEMPSKKQFRARPDESLAAGLEITAQRKPRVDGGHQPRAPFVIVERGGGDTNRKAHAS